MAIGPDTSGAHRLNARFASLAAGERPSSDLVNELTGYALTVMSTLIRTGRIFAECARKGRSLGETYRIPADQDIEDLVADAVLDGLELFRRNDSADRWRSGAGAAPTSYLVGACILCFPNIYRRYWRSRLITDRVLPVGAILDDDAGDTIRSAEASALGMGMLHAVLAECAPLQRAAIVLEAQGYSHREMADLLGVTHRSVEAHLRRGRKRLRTRFGDLSAAAIAARS